MSIRDTYLSNESDRVVDVYFDDMMVTHTYSPIVAGADYYPFGLPMEGREVAQEDWRWGYQGAFAEQDEETGYTAFELRMYDARFGRFISVDPYNEFYSPYVGMGNNPASLADPTGGCTSCPGIMLGEVVVTAANLSTPLIAKGFQFFTALTTFRIREIAIQQGVSTQPTISFNREVGRAFEQAGLNAFGLAKNAKSFYSTERAAVGNTGTVIPDAVRSVKVFLSDGTSAIYPNSSFFEMKAVNGIIGLSHSNYQILGLMDAAKNSPGAKAGRANVTFVTTANTVIGPDVLQYAMKYNISVHQSVALEFNGTGRVAFTPPIKLNPGKSISLPGFVWAWPQKIPFR